jgi:predicted lipase
MFSAQYVLDEPLPLMLAAYDLSLVPAGWDLLAKIEPQDFGFVARKGFTVVVSICGTHTPDQWLHDFDAKPEENPWGPGRVHVGFMEEYLMVRASIWDAIDKVGYDQLLILGHSLGGPMANYCAIDIAKNAPQFASRIVGYTFEGPKPGDSEFIQDFNQKVPNWWRIQNIRDIIPTLPPPPVFTEHEGTTIWVDGGHTLDVHVAHGLLTGVKPGLEKLLNS